MNDLTKTIILLFGLSIVVLFLLYPSQPLGTTFYIFIDSILFVLLMMWADEF
jgi:hypothetical protein